MKEVRGGVPGLRVHWWESESRALIRMGAEGQPGSGLAQKEELGVALGCLVAALPDPSMELLCRLAYVCAFSPPPGTLLLLSPGGPLSLILFLDATIEGLGGAQLVLPLVDFLLLEMHRSGGGVGWGKLAHPFP